MSSTEKQLKWTLNQIAKSDDTQVRNMSMEEMSKANNFHKSFPQYEVTPLTRSPQADAESAQDRIQ